MRNKIGALIILAGSAHAQAARFDPPDLNLEQELHRQYLQGGDMEMAPVSKDAYIENYRLQPGETLWSLSQTLYGDGQYWPRVWSQNKSITNPHLIRPGHTLQFLLGSEDETPSFRFTEGDGGGVELAASNGGSANSLIEIPPPEIPPRPLINVPKSFPEWQSVYKHQPVQVMDDRGLLKAHKPLVGKTYLTAFAQESPLEPAGRFLETDLESSLPTVNQYVYVRIDNGKAQTGQKMLIVKDLGRLQRMNKNTENVEAYLIEIAGEIELTEQAKGEDVDGDDVYRALITKTTGLALKDYRLILGEMQEVKLDYNGTPGVAEAQIIGAGKHRASNLYGPGDIVFLNKGSSSGIAEGQIFDIFVDRTTRKKDTPVRFSSASSGSVRVIRTTTNLSTAVVLGASDGIQPGDRVKQVSVRSDSRENIEFRDDRSHNRDEGDMEQDIDQDDGFDSGDSIQPDENGGGVDDEF